MPRRLLFAFVLVLLVGMAVPATADAPELLDEFSVTFVDFDPCTGLDQEITINFEIYGHDEHPNNYVEHVVRTGTTDTGYEVQNGVESFSVNKNVVRGTFHDLWFAPDGRKQLARGGFLFHFKKDELIVDRFSLTCVGGETILP